MAQHGYLREYDEDWDRDDDDRERWRGRDDDERERGFMLGDRDRERSSQYGRKHGYGGFQGDDDRGDSDQGGFGGRGDWERSPRRFSSHQDDHYRSWRDRQMQALDRDYEDYCREREEQFHRDFDSWRSRRRTNPEPLRTGRTQTGRPEDVSDTLELTSEETVRPQEGPDPMETATLGTETSGRG